MIKGFIIYCIGLYQRYISVLFIPCCRFSPTCSSFAVGAIKKHGVFLGALYSISRILKCHPLNKNHYYDPVP